MVSPEAQAVALFESLADAAQGHEKCRRLARALRSWQRDEGAELSALLSEAGLTELEPEARAALDERLDAAWASLGRALQPCAEHPATVEVLTEVGALLQGARVESEDVARAHDESGQRWGEACAAYFDAVDARCAGEADGDAACAQHLEARAWLERSGLDYGQSMVEQLEPVCARAGLPSDSQP